MVSNTLRSTRLRARPETRPERGARRGRAPDQQLQLVGLVQLPQHAGVQPQGQPAQPQLMVLLEGVHDDVPGPNLGARLRRRASAHERDSPRPGAIGGKRRKGPRVRTCRNLHTTSLLKGSCCCCRARYRRMSSTACRPSQASSGVRTRFSTADRCTCPAGGRAGSGAAGWQRDTWGWPCRAQV